MDKRKAIQIITKAAETYHKNLEDQKVLFLYGIPKEVKEQILGKRKVLSAIRSYEVVFHRQNFLHLTGVRVDSEKIKSSIHFYEKCLDKRLAEQDFSLAKDGSTRQKLDVLENMMKIKQSAMMIGDFTGKGPKLYSEKVAGNVCGCVGFVQDRHTGFNVPNTLLKKDIRDVTAIPVQKIYAVISKSYTEQKYSIVEKLDKSIDLSYHFFSEEIESILERKQKS